MNTRQLLKLMEENPDIKTRFSYVFKEFKSGTGYFLISELKPEDRKLIERDANLVFNYHLFGRGGR